jgi:outer membrane protein assembly factor BamA
LVLVVAAPLTHAQERQVTPPVATQVIGTRSVVLGLGVNTDAGLVGSVVLNERQKLEEEVALLREELKRLGQRLAAVEAQLGQASRPDAENPVRVGQIFVVGNKTTPTSTILKRVKLVPGQVLDYGAMRASERSLAALGLFVVNPERGIRPTVTVIEGDGPYQDILVTVQEKP